LFERKSFALDESQCHWMNLMKPVWITRKSTKMMLLKECEA